MTAKTLDSVNQVRRLQRLASTIATDPQLHFPHLLLRVLLWVPLLALSTHSKRSWVRFPAGAGPFYVEFACSLHVCMGFLRVLRFPPLSKHAYRSISSQYPGPRYWLRICSWSLTLRCGCLLLLRDWLNAETIFHCTLYM